MVRGVTKKQLANNSADKGDGGNIGTMRILLEGLAVDSYEESVCRADNLK